MQNVMRSLALLALVAGACLGFTRAAPAADLDPAVAVQVAFERAKAAARVAEAAPEAPEVPAAPAPAARSSPTPAAAPACKCESSPCPDARCQAYGGSGFCECREGTQPVQFRADCPDGKCPLQRPATAGVPAGVYPPGVVAGSGPPVTYEAGGGVPASAGPAKAAGPVRGFLARLKARFGRCRGCG